MPFKLPSTDWVSVSHAAKFLGVGVPTVHALIEDKRLTSRCIPPSYVRVLRTDVERLAEQHTTPARAS